LWLAVIVRVVKLGLKRALLSAVCCLLPAACCLLSTACCLLSATCCLLSAPAVCYLLSATCCLLLLSALYDTPCRALDGRACDRGGERRLAAAWLAPVGGDALRPRGAKHASFLRRFIVPLKPEYLICGDGLGTDIVGKG
jgi:hypothetical protein